jgi:hypothetical protein
LRAASPRDCDAARAGIRSRAQAVQVFIGASQVLPTAL